MSTLYFEDRRYAPRVTLHRWGPHGGQMWSRCSRTWVWDDGMVLRYQHGIDVFDLDVISEDKAMAHFPEAFGLPPPRRPYRLLAPRPRRRGTRGRSSRPSPSRIAASTSIPTRACSSRSTPDLRRSEQQTPLTIVPRGLCAPVTLESVAPTRAVVRCPPGLLAAIRRWPHGGSLTAHSGWVDSDHLRLTATPR